MLRNKTSLLITRKKYLLLFHILVSPWLILTHRYMELYCLPIFHGTVSNSINHSTLLQELLFACLKNLTIDLLQSLDQQKLSIQISSLQIDNQLRTTPYPVMLSFDHEYRYSSASQIRTKDKSAKTRSERFLPMASDNSCEPVFYLAVSKWRKKDISLVSFEYISLRCLFSVISPFLRV